jgi:transposase
MQRIQADAHPQRPSCLVLISPVCHTTTQFYKSIGPQWHHRALIALPAAGRRKQSPARNLLVQLWLVQTEMLALLDDFAIPFDNHQAELDLRMFKAQQRISGSIRSAAATWAYCRICGYLSALRKHRRALLQALQAILIGHSLLPASG